MGEPLMLDVVAPEAHQNDHRYVRELSRHEEAQKLSKLGGGHLRMDGRLPGTIQYISVKTLCTYLVCMWKIMPITNTDEI